METFSGTELPYIFLAESAVHQDTTVVRKGKVDVDQPTLVLPPNIPQFEGFDLDNTNQAVDFLLMRGVRFPSMKYHHKKHHLDIYNDKINEAQKYYLNRLQRKKMFIRGS